jgi:hypothetical protein
MRNSKVYFPIIKQITMKKILLAVLLGITVSSYSQALKPTLKKGTVLTYVVIADGQETPINISVDSIANDFLRFSWNMEGLGTGKWIVHKASLEKAERAYWDDLAPNNDVEIPEGQSIVMFSKAQWASFQKDKKLNFDQQTFTAKKATGDQVIKVNGKEIDAIYLEGENGTTRLWIANNAKTPFLVKISGNTIGPDVELRSIK